MTELTRRELMLAGMTLPGLLALSTARSALAALPQAAAAADPLSFVHPELRAAARQAQPLGQALSAMTAETLPTMRGAADAMMPPPLDAPPVERRTVPGSAGEPDVEVYVINAKPGASRPGILHVHGGGYVTGSASASVRPLQEVAAALDCCAVTVEYRLAPETTYAGSVEDNYASLLWLYRHADEVGVDPQRLAVMGESAGGGHAALLAIAARDRGEVPLAFQLLVYPMLDDRTGSTREVPPQMGRIVWTATANRFGWGAFLGQEAGGASVPSAGVPARVASVEGLAPAFIGVGGIDLFVLEDIEYARRLIEAGVPTQLLVVPGAFHGFDGLAADTAIAQRFNAAKLDALRGALAADSA